VPAAPPAEHATVGLPLLDLLVPEQEHRQGPPPPSYQQPPAYPQPEQGNFGLLSGYSDHPGDYGPQAGYAEQPGYSQQTGYAQQPGYVQDPGYAQQPPYAQQPYPPQQPGYPQQVPYQQRSGLPPYPPGRARSGPARLLERPGAKLVLALATGVLVLALLGIWALSSSTPKRSTAEQGSRSGAPTTSAVRVAGGYQFTQSAARSDTDCAANAYGKVAEFFRSTPCTMLDRALYKSTVDGRPVVVSVSVVRMPNEQAATELQKLTDANGTGNVADLLRAGVQVPGGPDKLTDAGYASTRDGATVIIAEADYADPAASNEAQLDSISEAALQLRK
jgi:hypothetical protein